MTGPAACPRWLPAQAACLLALGCHGALAAQATDVVPDNDYEPAVVLMASEVIPETWRTGPHHSVRELVVNDGFINQYVIDSEFGEFVAESNLVLRTRVGEIGALAELDKLSRTRVFVDAAGNAAVNTVTAPVRTLTAIVTRPVGTVTGLPGGVRRMFARFGRRAKSAVNTAGDVAQRTGEVARDAVDRDDQASDGGSEYGAGDARRDATRLADRYFNVSSGERRWAAKLNVDPYTDNEVLARALKEVGRIDRAGDLATSLVPIVPGVRALDYLGMVNEAVWERDAFELKRLNRERLRDAYGLSVDAAEAFLDNGVYTPTMQTVLVNALLETRGVPNLADFITVAAGAETMGEARYQMLTGVMLVWLSRFEGQLGELRTSGPLTLMVSADGDAHALLPVDYLSWNAALDAALQVLQADLGDTGARRMYLTGEASPLARRMLQTRGWQLREALAGEITAGMIGLRERRPDAT